MILYYFVQEGDVMRRIVSISVLLVSLCSVLYAQVDLQPIVNIKLNKSESVTVKQLKSRVEIYKKQMGITSFTLDQKKEILDALIDERLVLQAAAKDGIVLTDSQVNKYFLDNISSQVGKNVTEQEFAALVKEQTNLNLDDFMVGQVGMNVADYKLYLKNQLIAQQYIMAKRPDVMSNASPTDTEVRSYYEMNKTSFVQSDILKLFLVIVPKGSDSNAALQKAKSIMEEVKSSKITLQELKAKAKDDTTGMQAGDMYVSKTQNAAQQLGIDYESLLSMFTKQIGFYSDINETTSDYQFYTIRERYDARMLTLSDIVQPDTTVTVYEYIKNTLAQQKQALAFTEATTEVTASLRTPENYQMLKTGEALDKLLEW